MGDPADCSVPVHGLILSLLRVVRGLSRLCAGPNTSLRK